MSHRFWVPFLSSSFSLESMLACGLVIHELARGKCADTTGQAGWSWLEHGEAGHRASREQSSYRNRALLHYAGVPKSCVILLCVSQRQAKSRPACTRRQASRCIRNGSHLGVSAALFKREYPWTNKKRRISPKRAPIVLFCASLAANVLLTRVLSRTFMNSARCYPSSLLTGQHFGFLFHSHALCGGRCTLPAAVVVVAGGVVYAATGTHQACKLKRLKPMGR